MEMYAFIARVAYRKPGTTASGMFSQGGCRVLIQPRPQAAALVKVKDRLRSRRARVPSKMNLLRKQF